MANILSGFSKTFLIWDVAAVSDAIDAITKPPVSRPTPLNAFSTVYSELPTPSGIINVPVPTYPTGADSFASGVVITDAQETTYQLTVNNDAGKMYAVRPGEIQQYGLEYIVKSYLAPAIYAIDATLNSASFALLSTFVTSSVKPATSTAFSSSNMTALNVQLSNAGINGDRFCVLNTAYYWNLVNDLSNKNNQVGADAVVNGSANNPFKMTTLEAQLLPSLSNLVGFVGTKNAIALGTAIPQVVHPNGNQFVYKSPWTGIPYLVEDYYDESNRKRVVGASVIYGAASVNPSIQRIVSS